ncbi:protein translocase subunit SecDF [Neolewinella antarctica]|uniref:Multifunctional fusion protein n=1 Tax=Neolewinella antarctica TaxID=442734 RepID=A0ABX0X820_9BACT|nr:protein translocase subunit SecDF [Neolewinella antarctica]NJC25381.1 SecD/SecF fusion protein [Neolewinella antarctica]
MQGKGIIKFFLVVMLLVTIFQYFFYIPTSAVENDAADYAEEQSGQTEGEAFRTQRAFFLDSITDQEVFKIPLLKSYTYQDLKQQQLALGLDLKGGMSIVLQVDLRDFIRKMARNSQDDALEKAIEAASQAQKTSQDDYITLFESSWNDVKGTSRLAPIFSRNDALTDDIDQNTSDAEVIRVLREKADETVVATYGLVSRRIDKLGVVQPNITLDAERNLILAELPGIENPEAARRVMTTAANLEFFDVLPIDNTTIQALVNADQLLDRRKKIADGRDSNYVAEVTYQIDTTYRVTDEGNLTDEIESIDSLEVANQTAGPLFSIFSPNNGNLGPAVLGISTKGNLDKVTELLEDREVSRLFPRNAIYRWEAEPLPGQDNQPSNLYALYQLNMPRSGEAPLSGEYITDASSSPDPNGQIAVNLRMNPEGSQIWARMTTDAANAGNRQVAIALDDRIVSAPRVNGAITGGSTAITGGFNTAEARDLANILQVGRLPADLIPVQESIIGPSLGAENIRSSMVALIIGFALVLLFMIVYYGGAGIVSILSLLLNLVFIFGALASLGTVLTLPGIAGILLTIGMAVDANVIIYERIREELRIGKTLVNSIADGYSNSYSAIIDANVTTLLVAGVLMYFGVGPIKGFAVVLAIGVLFTMFTAVLVNRLIIEWWLGRSGNITFWTGFSKNLFANVNVDWMGKRKVAYGVSALLVLGSLAAIFTRGFDLSVDFQGGYSYVVELDQEVAGQDLSAALTAPFGGNLPTVKSVGSDNTYNIVTKYMVDQRDDVDGVAVETVVLTALYDGIKAATGNNDLTFEQFSNSEALSGTRVTQINKVGPTIADDIKNSAYWAAGVGLLFIGLYLLIRFSRFRYSVGAVVALFHDSIIVMGVFALFWGRLGFNMEVDQAFIAAILTVIGYSINDTVIVFDRIREFLNTYVSLDKTQVINNAINSTVSRTVITSLTTALVVLVLLLFGGDSIKGFAFALLVGIIVGTYSSIFVATPIVHDLMDESEARETVVTTEPTVTTV